MAKRFELAEKISLKELRIPTKKHSNEEPLVYISTYNKNNLTTITTMIKFLKNTRLKKND